MKKTNINDVMMLVLRDAENKKMNAGYSGSYGDGGASVLVNQVKFYKYGMAGVVPPEWKEYENQLDDEYEEYLRLKKKFG